MFVIFTSMLKRALASIFLLIFVVVSLFGFANSSSYAQEENSTPSSSVKTATSFELFWPLVAGKTNDESFYFLKKVKEQVRGLFYFSPELKADYSVFLATKRLLEAEKLLSLKKKDNFEQTMSEAKSNIQSAEKYIEEAKSRQINLGNAKSTMKPRLDNMELFTKKLIEDNAENKDTLQGFLEEVSKLNSNFN